MINSLWNGISGLNIYQDALNNESNNISNANTVAYKSDTVSFSDLLYQDKIGLGAKISQVSKDFSQGGIKSTGNPYDMAIKGDGFFTVQDNFGLDYYTRSGDFRMSEDGFLQTPDQNYIMGLSIGDSQIVTTNSAKTKFTDDYSKYLSSASIDNGNTLASINAKATDYTQTATTTGTSGNNYKTASSHIQDIETLTNAYNSALSLYASEPTSQTGTSSVAQQTQVSYDPTTLTKESDQLSIYVDGVNFKQNFDTNATTTLNKLADQISGLAGFSASVDSTTGVMTIDSLVPGKNVNISGAKINDDLVSTVNTVDAVQGTGKLAYTSVRDALEQSLQEAGADFLEITNSIDTTASTTENLQKLQLRPDVLGITNSANGDVEVVNDAIYKKQDNNRFLLGKVATVDFTSKEGLNPVGSNLFEKTSLSGDPVVSNSQTSIVNNSLELSNADLSISLTNLIVYQRSFEANSKTVTTSDEFLKTAIGLKK